MNVLQLNPVRDAGRFAYHLKSLLKADLIEPDVENKKYRLTDIGRMVVDIAESIEERVYKKRKMMVRTSRLAMEEFDRNKIVDSLVREADVPLELAQRIARETERRLLEFKTKYLTAPLIREIVNAILVEKGLEEHRHRLTRLGLPVYDVTQLIKSIGAKAQGVEAIHEAAGSAVIEEYTLLNVLPRDIADAHLSGSLHICNLDSWILKPREFMHNFRFFLQRGLNLGEAYFTHVSHPPPKTLESAVLTASNLFSIAASEISGEQALDYFNVFLAPFAHGLSPERIREGLRLFILDLNRPHHNGGLPVQASLGLELVTPDFLEEKEAVGPDGKKVGSYGDFTEESRLVASLLLEMMREDIQHKPIFNPSLIVKIRPETLADGECETLLFQAHRLAAESGLPYFANLCAEGQKSASYTATGCRFADDWNGDWELDTLQVGNMGSVIVNLPRVSYDAQGNQSRFFELLDEQLEMTRRALEIKHYNIMQRAREGMLPFLTQGADGDSYFRLSNSSHLISFVGLNEAVYSLTGKATHEDDKASTLAEDIVKYLQRFAQKSSKKPGTRFALSTVPSPDVAKRLAGLDVERYGWAKVCVQGSKEQPFYTDIDILPLKSDASWERRLSAEEKLHELTSGGHLALLQLDDSEKDPNELLSLTRYIIKSFEVGLYTYSRNLTYCANCRKTFLGTLPNCTACGSINRIVHFGRASAKYLPLPS